MMTTKEFIGYYRMAKDKKTECEKRVVKKYVSFITKIAECERVVRATTMYEDVENNIPATFSLNTPMRYLLFNMTLIGYYTDLELDKDLIKEYDALNEYGAFDMLISCLPEHEYKEFKTLLDMTLDDYMANNRELTSYIDQKLDGLMQLALANEKAETDNG